MSCDVAPRNVRQTGLVFLLIAVSGCGFALVNGPPSDHQKLDDFSCTEGNLGPTLDAIVAAGGVLAALSGTLDEEPESFVEPTGGALIVTGGAMAAGWGASSILGFNKTSDCREARGQLRQRQSGSASSDTTSIPDR